MGPYQYTARVLYQHYCVFLLYVCVYGPIPSMRMNEY